MKWEKGDQREIPDDNPLDEAELARLDAQRARSQAALISRAATQGMTPMELFASGQVTTHAPDDALTFDKSRQLAPAEEPSAISEEVSPKPSDIVHAVAVEPSPLKARMEEWLAKDQGRSFMAGFDGYFERGMTPPYMGTSMPDGNPSPHTHEAESVPLTSEPINDDEVVEGEIVSPIPKEELFRLHLDEDDIVDAEVIDAD